jgi:hypothetical protein
LLGGPTMKVLLYDIEISPLLGWAYQLWDANIIHVERDSHILCFAFQWLGDSKVHVVAQPDFKGYEKYPHDDKLVVEALWDLLDEADVVIAHNAVGFDNKVANACFLKHGMTPPSPYRTVDTLKVCRSKFKFPSNALAKLAKQLEMGSKSKTTHADLWRSCIDGDARAWKLMKRYCAMDVKLLHDLYVKVRPYTTTHPNVAVEDGFACPKCGGTKLQSRGFRYTQVGKYRRYACLDCGGWASRREAESNRPELVSA